MKKEFNKKKGQFYIISAIIIIFVLAGFFFAVNKINVKKEQGKIYDLGKELDIETGYVYDYGIYNENNTQELIKEWAKTYYNYTKDVVEDWIFVYGNENNATALYFTKEESGDICIKVGAGTPPCLPMEKTIYGKKKGEIKDKKIKVEFKGVSYNFDLKEGQNFYFVIRGGEYVSSKKGK